jgi:ELWxxDGT repeat protein
MRVSEICLAVWSCVASLAYGAASNEAPAGSLPSALTNVNGTLYFTADDRIHGRELWKSDGAAAGTVMVKDLAPGKASSIVQFLTQVDNTLFFVVLGTQSEGAATEKPALWKSDGSEEGTVKVKDVQLGWELAAIKDVLFFVAQDEIHGKELWKSDGTEKGTVMVKDIYPGSRGSGPEELTDVDGVLFFTADDETEGTQLWKSDGTETGSQRVARTNHERLIVSVKPRTLTNVNGTLFFRGVGANQGSLWKSDGTEAGTMKLKSVAPDNVWWSPATPQNVGGTFFFRVQRGGNGGELWKSDGTEVGTVRVKEIRPGDETWAPALLTIVNGTLYFRGSDRTQGGELWKSDGTEAGTVLVKEIRFGRRNVWLNDLTNVNGTLFFTVAEPTAGASLWKSDGTEAGTVMVEAFPSSKPWHPYMPVAMGPLTAVAVGKTVFFVADDGIHGWELWKSDGTTDGTAMVRDIRDDK